MRIRLTVSLVTGQGFFQGLYPSGDLAHLQHQRVGVFAGLFHGGDAVGDRVAAVTQIFDFLKQIPPVGVTGHQRVEFRPFGAGFHDLADRFEILPHKLDFKHNASYINHLRLKTDRVRGRGGEPARGQANPHRVRI